MKILHIINSLATGGAEKLIVETLPLYNEKGIETDVLLLNGTEYPLYKELQEKNCCRIYSLGKTSVYNPKLIGKIIPYLKKYDLIHVHLFPAQYFAIAAKRLSFSKKPFVFTEHNTSNRRIENKWFAFPEKIIYAGYKKVICITAEVKRVLQKHVQLHDQQLEIIENGINLHTLHTAQTIPKSSINPHLFDHDFVLLQVAGFRPQKDQSTLIRALQHLPEHVKLVLAGDGILRKDCEKLVQDLNLEERVFFLGLRDDIPSLLKSCDVIVLSSKYEGLSLSSIEGMASGKPFLASDVPGLSEVVDGAGILFPQGDDRKLAEEISKLINNKEWSVEVAEKCMNRAENYDIHRMVEDHIQLYQSILSKK